MLDEFGYILQVDDTVIWHNVTHNFVLSHVGIITFIDDGCIEIYWDHILNSEAYPIYMFGKHNDIIKSGTAECTLILLTVEQRDDDY